MASLPISCIGKCITGLSSKELDQITDDINKTLSHPKGRKIFQKYLETQNLQSSLDCLELYKLCSTFLAEEHQSRSENFDIISLIENVTMVKEFAEDINGVPQIDMALMERFNEALTREKTRDALLAVLEDTRDRARDFLRRVHGSFKKYASQPCPLTK